jgi:hypothetical protein
VTIVYPYETIKMPPLQFTYADVLRENSAYIGGIVIIGVLYFIYSVSRCE